MPPGRQLSCQCFKKEINIHKITNIYQYDLKGNSIQLNTLSFSTRNIDFSEIQTRNKRTVIRLIYASSSKRRNEIIVNICLRYTNPSKTYFMQCYVLHDILYISRMTLNLKRWEYLTDVLGPIHQPRYDRRRHIISTTISYTYFAAKEFRYTTLIF